MTQVAPEGLAEAVAAVQATTERVQAVAVVLPRRLVWRAVRGDGARVVAGGEVNQQAGETDGFQAADDPDQRADPPTTVRAGGSAEPAERGATPTTGGLLRRPAGADR